MVILVKNSKFYCINYYFSRQSLLFEPNFQAFSIIFHKCIENSLCFLCVNINKSVFMEVRPKKNLALALGKFSKLLIQEKIIDAEADQSALVQALGNAASNLSTSCDKKSTTSSVDFVKGHLAVMMAKHEKSQNKIEKMRKQKEIEEKSQLKQKPSINSNSKRIVTYKQINIPPLHERTEKILKEKSGKLEIQRNHRKQQEDNEFLKQCTFKPHSRSQSSRSRSPESLTKELYKWNENRNKELEKKRKEKTLQEDSQINNKPKIDNLSSRLSKNVIFI